MIVFFTAHYYPHAGGIEAYVAGLSGELSRRGFRTAIVTTQYPGKPFHERAGDCDIYRLSAIPLMGGRFPVPWRPDEWIRVSWTLSRDDTVVLQTRFFLTSLLGACVGRAVGAPVVGIEHGSGHFVYHNRVARIWSSVYEHGLTRLLMMITPMRWFGVSQAACSWLSHFHIHAAGVVTNAVGESVIPAKHKTDPYIFYAARLVAAKGLPELIAGFQEFAQTHPSYRLVIAGTGELSQTAHRAAQSDPRIQYLGAVSHEEVMSLMKNASWYVNPSQYPEGLPTTVLEAGICKTPVITSSAGGAAEAVRDGIDGIVLQIVDAQSVAAACASVADDTERASRMAASLYSRVRDSYNWRVAGDQFLNSINA